MRTAQAALLALVLWLPAAGGAAEPESGRESVEESTPMPQTEEIVIQGRRSGGTDKLVLTPEHSTPSAPDAAALMQGMPGGAVDWNGPLSGQVQYRGMSGPRMGVRLGNRYVDPGGPNWMDPPLHYAPRALLDSLDVERGIAPVSAGAETLGGSARARLKQSDFSEDGRLRFTSDVDIEGRSADEAISGGGIVSVVDGVQRLQLLGSADRGTSFDSPLGRVRNTRFERYQVGSAYARRFGAHQVGASYRFNDTKDTGTPALPMDIRFFHTQLLDADYSGKLGDVDLDGRVYYTDIDHRMDNFSLRPPPLLPAAFRKIDASSQSGGFELQGAIPLPLGTLTLGTDGHWAGHDMAIRNPNAPPFLIRNFDDVRRDRYGGFAEWTAKLPRSVDARIGVRYARVDSDAGDVFVFAGAPAGPQILAQRFNDASHQRSDDLFDAVARLNWQAREDLLLELAGGRKTRAPSYIERYSWLPIEVTAGLADGHNYVGDIGLDPEVSYEVAGGFTWSGFRLYASPRAFYKRVYDYIQGQPFCEVGQSPSGCVPRDQLVIDVSTANGDPDPLQWSNVEAELYGVDADLGVDLPGPLQLDGNISYVRGRRLDIDDNLYRIAPLRGRATLSWQAGTWFAAVEGIFAARQDEVSETNGETPTAGYEFMNLYAGWEPWKGLQLTAGIDNVTDATWRDHLAGFNRVADSAVPVGQRLPGPGISFYGRVKLRWGTAME